MKRKAIRKRTVSCIIALALVFSCFLTSYAGSIVSYTGDKGDGKTEVIISTNAGKIWYDIGSRHSWTVTEYKGSPDLGAHCKLTAEDTKSRVFMYWLDSYSERVYSFERTIEFDASSRISLRAVFARVTDATHQVAFVNYGGSVMQSDAYNVGETISAPTDTKVPGFTFKGWSMSDGEIAADSGDLVVYPKYTVNDETYTVTLTDETYASGAGEYSNFQTVNLKAEPVNGSGDSFSYWQNDSGEIVSYDRNYSFRINYNTTLTAVYGESVTPEPVIRISKINRDISDMKLTFYAERSVPEGYTLVSHGMLMASGTSVTDTGMTLANAGDSATATVRKGIGASNEPCGTYSLAKAKVGRNTEVTVRPFLICQDANDEFVVVYGDIIRTTNASTD